MPKSRIRRKADFTPPPERQARGAGISGRWIAPIMVTLLVLGLAWIVVYYVTEASLPLMSQLGGWNLVIGMGLITAGFVAATKWK
ncbi:MAG TPA: cell division protein CrgA [Jiangellaceae bacterium]|nr:cell division protein CrgA [Jiangellaceae bacterium]